MLVKVCNSRQTKGFTKISDLTTQICFIYNRIRLTTGTGLLIFPIKININL